MSSTLNWTGFQIWDFARWILLEKVELGTMLPARLGSNAFRVRYGDLGVGIVETANDC